MTVTPKLLLLAGLLLLANAAYSKYEQNQLAQLTELREATRMDLVVETLVGSLLVVVSTMCSLFARNNENKNNRSLMKATLKEGHWVVDALPANGTLHPLTPLTPLTPLQQQRKSPFAALSTRAAFCSLPARAARFDASRVTSGLGN